ncbi:MAG: heme-copper oxidase subunit III [Thermoleophilaceae bacterium]|nr:heme-copper oxidase subunit III [Thermoleophilaceae bacterium]
MESASIAAGHAAHDQEHEHHGPPEANVSSRVEAQFLGMLLFIVSELMLFGAFFTAYFFIRVVAESGWFPIDGQDLPVAIAAVNSGILLSSSLTMHWALEGARRGNRRALQVGLLTTFGLGLTFLTIQVNEYVHLGFPISENAQTSVFYGLTGLHGAHVVVGLTLLGMATTRAFRGHYSPEQHRGVEVPGIYWHFVDIMWIFVFSTLYIL